MYRHIVSVCLLIGLVALTGCPPAQQEASTPVTLENEDQKTVYAMGLALAGNLAAFNLGDEEIVVLEQGLRDGLTGAEPKVELAEYRGKMQELARTRSAAIAEAEKAKSDAWVAEQGKREGAVVEESGLIYIETAVGTGDSPSATDTVKVHYHGSLRDGTVFDSSVDRGQPFTTRLGSVIPCWTEGLQKMKPGGKATLICPADIAYRDRGAPPHIKPGAALSFDVELIEIVEK